MAGGKTMMLVDSELLRDSRNARLVRDDDDDVERPRLIVLPPVIAPVVASPPLLRRRPRRTRSAPTLAETVAISLGLIVTVAGLVAAGIFWNRISEPPDRPALVTTAPEPTPIERVAPIGPTGPQ
jgi:hypothetical protein